MDSDGSMSSDHSVQYKAMTSSVPQRNDALCLMPSTATDSVILLTTDGTYELFFDFLENPLNIANKCATQSCSETYPCLSITVGTGCGKFCT
jgi:hypothetical protein